MNKKIVNLLPLIMLLAAAIYLLLSVLISNVVLVKWHIVGLVFLAIATTAQVFNARYGYFFTALLLIFGTFSFAALTPWIVTFGIGPIQFDLFFVLATLVFVVVHRNQIPDWIRELRSDK